MTIIISLQNTYNKVVKLAQVISIYEYLNMKAGKGQIPVETFFQFYVFFVYNSRCFIFKYSSNAILGINQVSFNVFLIYLS